MDIDLPFTWSANLRNFMRRAGYAEFNDINSGQTSYTKRLDRDYYPRFHVYLHEKDGGRSLNLHLDQKKPSYAGAHAHNAEYEGGRVETEGQRLKSLIASQLNNQPPASPPAEKNFWQRLLP